MNVKHHYIFWVSASYGMMGTLVTLFGQVVRFIADMRIWCCKVCEWGRGNFCMSMGGSISWGERNVERHHASPPLTPATTGNSILWKRD